MLPLLAGAGAAAWALAAAKYPLFERGEVLRAKFGRAPVTDGDRFCMIAARLLFVAAKVF